MTILIHKDAPADVFDQALDQTLLSSTSSPDSKAVSTKNSIVNSLSLRLNNRDRLDQVFTLLSALGDIICLIPGAGPYWHVIRLIGVMGSQAAGAATIIRTVRTESGIVGSPAVIPDNLFSAEKFGVLGWPALNTPSVGVNPSAKSVGSLILSEGSTNLQAWTHYYASSSLGENVGLGLEHMIKHPSAQDPWWTKTFSRSLIFRTPIRHLDPNVLGRPSTWLYLRSLSSSFGPVLERYSFADDIGSMISSRAVMYRNRRAIFGTVLAMYPDRNWCAAYASHMVGLAVEWSATRLARKGRVIDVSEVNEALLAGKTVLGFECPKSAGRGVTDIGNFTEFSHAYIVLGVSSTFPQAAPGVFQMVGGARRVYGGHYVLCLDGNWSRSEAFVWRHVAHHTNAFRVY